MNIAPLEHDSILLPAQCTAVVLAGGQGSRMGGADKGLLPWQDTTLAGHAARRLAALGLPVMISANRNQERYAALGHAVVADLRSGYPGPLAAIEAALHQATTPWVLGVPCDSPWFPETLAARLWAACAGASDPANRIDAAYARCGAHRHPVFWLASTRLAAPLSRFLDDGGRRVIDWWQAVGASAVDFGEAAEPAFANANTAAELDRLAQRQVGGG